MNSPDINTLRMEFASLEDELSDPVTDLVQFAAIVKHLVVTFIDLDRGEQTGADYFRLPFHRDDAQMVAFAVRHLDEQAQALNVRFQNKVNRLMAAGILS